MIGVLLLGLFACDDSNVNLDNPRNVSATFVVDGGAPVVVGSKGQGEMGLEPGAHSIKVEVEGEVIADTTIEIRGGGILHSGAQTYLIWRQLYGLQNDRETLLNEKWTEFDSLRAFGDFRIYPKTQIFIEQNWDLGLGEDLPDEEVMYISEDFKIQSKIFRAPDFVATYRDMAGQ